MSSRVFVPEDNRQSAPIVWRQVGRGAVPDAPQADPVAELAIQEHEIEARVQAARAAGYREGEQAGRNRASAELQSTVAKLAATVTELARLRPELRRQAESDVVRLSLAIARRVLRRELTADPDSLRGLVIAALEKVQLREVTRVKIHPALAAALAACLREAGAGTGIEVVADPTLESGALLFETERGNLDASIGTQLEEIERGLTDRLKRPS
jgi:flagellar assembly protein FliH